MEDSGASSVRKDVANDGCEGFSCCCHELRSVEGEIEGLDGGEGCVVCKGSAEVSDARETAGSESASSLFKAGVVVHHGSSVVDLFSGEESLAAHRACASGWLLEPFGDATLAEGVLAGKLDWRDHWLCQADRASVGGTLHWYQTSGEEVGASWESHLCSVSLVRSLGVRVLRRSPGCVLASRNEGV